MRSIFLTIIMILASVSNIAFAFDINGKVVDKEKQSAIYPAVITIPGRQLWAVTDEKGAFAIKGVPAGNYTVIVSCLGYVKTEFNLYLTSDTTNLVLPISEDNLTLQEIVVTAQENKHSAATSYIIDKAALEHHQVTNITDISTLLPGGKTANSNNLATESASRFEIRANSGELGNPTFMTAVEVDGIRLSNNASFSGANGIDTKNIATTNIESVEIITGIPSVEYGDVSGGVVNIKTKKGSTPLEAFVSVSPKTRTYALSKGFNLGANNGLINLSLERTESTSDPASPYTKYDRNGATILYSNTLGKGTSSPLSITANLTGNIGGYNSKADPDLFTGTYTKIKDNTIRGSVGFDWLVNKPFLTGIEAKAFINYADKQRKEKTNKSSATSVVAAHGKNEGYFIATDYDTDPNADISLIPAGYWYEIGYIDDKPIEYNASMKLYHNVMTGNVLNKLKAGASFSSVGNKGIGTYYDDPRYTPTWRSYPYNEIPYMNNISAYIEDAASFAIGSTSMLLTGGVRYDHTKVDGSGYGSVSAFSPRASMKYTIINSPASPGVKSLNIRAGFGEAVKLPSFGILYPEPSYRSIQTFTPGAMADGSIFYAYYIRPTTQLVNDNLKWQRSRQFEVAAEMKIGQINVSLSAYHNKSKNGYTTNTHYTPFTYKYTNQSAIEGTNIPAADRRYKVDQQTGIVTMYDINGVYDSQELAYGERLTLKSDSYAANTSPVKRQGLEWVVDFGRIKSLNTSFRYDGSFYHYRGINENLISYMPVSTQNMSNGMPYKYVGYYAGSSNSGNGSETKRVNSNVTVTTNIPKIKLLVSLRVEATLYHATQNLSEYNGKTRGFVIDSKDDYTGTSRDIYAGDQYVIIYPEYYASADDITKLIPFEEAFLNAKENDKALYNELAKLTSKTNTSYYFNKDKISPYFSANVTVSKEIGRYFTVAFYANNFFNSLMKVKSSANDTETSLFESSRISRFNYGVSLRVKL